MEYGMKEYRNCLFMCSTANFDVQSLKKSIKKVFNSKDTFFLPL